MRNIQKLIAFVFVLLLGSCSTDDIITTDDTNDIINAKSTTSSSGPPLPTAPNSPMYSEDSLVVQFKNGTSPSQKAAIRAANGVGNFEICNCNSKDIELWYFVEAISIEPKRKAIKVQIDPKSSTGLHEVDYEFEFALDPPEIGIGGADDASYEAYINSGNPGITVAVLDSGIATHLPVFNSGLEAKDILYDAVAAEMDVNGEKSGWDFVDEDPNTFDDEMGKHGSIITNTISSKLSENGIAHQILPVKVSNNLGKISYFNFLCGTLYAMERAEIVNISMGWLDDGFGEHIDSIFSNLASEFSDVILVTSAGNFYRNNDEDKHYPSSYDHPNILAVASSNAAFSKVSNYSNYGPFTVDFFAQGEEIGFMDYTVQGTSFAAPQVTLEVARILSENPDMSVATLRWTLDSEGTELPDFFVMQMNPDTMEMESRNTAYNKIIIPFE